MRSLTYLIFLLLCSSLGGQTVQLLPPEEQYNDFVYEDTAGFLWISSLNGWYRTDGRQFTLHGVPEGDRRGFDRFVQSPLFPGPSGGLWYTGFNGIHRIAESNGTTESFRVTIKGDSLKEGYRAFYFDEHAEELWLRVDGQLGAFNVRDHSFQLQEVESTGYGYAVRTFPDGQPEVIVGCPWLDAPGFEILTRVSPDEPWQRELVSFPLKDTDTRVTNVLFLSAEQLLLSTFRGLATYNIREKSIQFLVDSFPGQVPAQSATDLQLDTLSQMLYATFGEQSLWGFPLSAPGQVDWQSAREMPEIDRATQLNQDRNGHIWVTTLKEGIYRLGNAPPPLFGSPGEINDLADLKYGPDGLAYGVSAKGSIYQLRSKAVAEEYPQVFSVDPKITHLGFDWANLYLFSDTKSYRFPIPPVDRPLVKEIPVFDVPSVLVHPSGQQLISGENGVFLDKGLDTATFRRPPAFEKMLGWDADLLNFQPGGHLALAYRGNALWLGRWTPDTLEIQKRIPVGYYILASAGDYARDVVWIGTTEGLFKYSEAGLEAVPLAPQQVFTPDINNILITSPDRLILGTDQGLIALDAATGLAKHFTIADGLPSHNFKAGTIGMDQSGYGWVVADGTPVHFIPDSLFSYAPALPTPYLQEIQVDGVAYESPEAIHLLNSLTLGPGTLNLGLRLSNQGLYEPTATSIATRIPSLDSTWTIVNNGGVANFRNLPAGNYWIEIVSRNKNNIPGLNKKIRLLVTPPLYQRPVFIIILFVIVAFLSALINYWISQNKIKALTAQHEKQSAISSERMRIAEDLHDDLGGDLNSILSIIDTARYFKATGISDQSVDMDELHALVSDASDNMREMVWAIDDGKGQFYHLLEQLTDLVRKRCKGIRKVQIDIPEDIPERTFSAIQKRNIFLIIKEGLQNIDKHAKGATMCSFQVRINTGPQQFLEISLADDGPGLSHNYHKQKVSNSGYGISNMQSRAQALAGHLTLAEVIPNGTKLCLTIPLEA